ncbi:MAG TPA: hypothetical protein VGG48_01715 [Rhizomicrobium sp.]|jgi:hypothetical protein
MPGIVCGFRFDDHTYVVIADIRDGAVRNIASLLENKGPDAVAVYEKAAVLGALVRDGMPFAELEALATMGPINKAIVAAVSRGRDALRRSLASCPGGDPTQFHDGMRGPRVRAKLEGITMSNASATAVAALATASTNPFIQLWDDIKAEAEKVYDELKTVAVNLEQDAVADIKQVFQVGAPIALQAVITEAGKTITGEEKFGNAVTNVTQQLEVKLGPVAEQDVQALVQTAYRGAQAAIAN